MDDDRVWTAPVWLEGTVAPEAPSGPSAVALAVDLVLEEARITNVGAEPLDLTGWRLRSVRGDQVFTFPSLELAPDASVTVVAGPDRTADPPVLLVWPWDQRVWNNDGDPAELYDAEGCLVAEVGR